MVRTPAVRIVRPSFTSQVRKAPMICRIIGCATRTSCTPWKDALRGTPPVLPALRWITVLHLFSVVRRDEETCGGIRHGSVWFHCLSIWWIVLQERRQDRGYRNCQWWLAEREAWRSRGNVSSSFCSTFKRARYSQQSSHLLSRS